MRRLLGAISAMVMLQGLFMAPAAAQSVLPEKLHTTIDKTLDDQFSDIEKELTRTADIDPKAIVLITVPLENYIEDVLFRINRPVVIYPRLIYATIRTQLKEGKSRTEVEQILVEMQKHRDFDKLYESQKQKM